jgi:broad specificity phosphatase PhoE
MEIFLIRHGEFDFGTKEKNPPLVKAGRKQAQLIAKRLSKIKFDKIYSSDLKRNLQTLEYVKKYHKCPIIINPELREIHREVNGAKRRKYVALKVIRDEKARINSAWKKILKNSKKSRILLVVHGNLINYLLSKFLGIHSRNFWKIMIWPTSLTVVETDGKNYLIKFIGNTSHLKDEHFTAKCHLNFQGYHV